MESVEDLPGQRGDSQMTVLSERDGKSFKIDNFNPINEQKLISKRK
jgi:hypothetical protein